MELGLGCLEETQCDHGASSSSCQVDACLQQRSAAQNWWRACWVLVNKSVYSWAQIPWSCGEDGFAEGKGTAVWIQALGGREPAQAVGDTRRAGTEPRGLVLLVPCWEAAQLIYALLKYCPQSGPIWANWQGSPDCKVQRKMQIEPEEEPAANFSRGSVLRRVRNCRYFPRDGLHVAFSTLHHSFADELHRLVQGAEVKWKLGFVFPI